MNADDQQGADRASKESSNYVVVVLSFLPI